MCFTQWVSGRYLICTLGVEGLCLPPQSSISPIPSPSLSVLFAVWEREQGITFEKSIVMTLAHIIHIHGEPSTSAHKMIFKSFINALKSRPAQPSSRPVEDVLLTRGKLAWRSVCPHSSFPFFLPFSFLWWLSYLYLQVTQGDRHSTQAQMTNQNKVNNSHPLI